MNVALVAAVLGGVGLFLLGMWLMTEGLKLAAGRALRRILTRSTRTIPHGIASGAFITAVVQSSSAVTVATVGFVNAGLIGLAPAIAVIYGANIGTTMTGWLVAVIGFHVNIAAFALPAIGLGMLARLFGAEGRLAALGQALAGFGLFFLGIDFLKDAFSGLGDAFDLAAMGGGGVLALLGFVGAGIVLTTLMQSSSAAMAITLTAAAGGTIPLNAAAAVVIGTNIGTTSTAALAAIGATPNARRVAAAHVVFNVIAGAAALVLLPVLIALLDFLQPWFGAGGGYATLLAAFHTLFNVLGVVIVAPATTRLVGFLETRFRAGEEDEARPKYLDRNVVATPVLAMHALARELGRLGEIARRMLKGALSTELAPARELTRDKMVLDRLVEVIGEFSARLQRVNLPAELNNVLPNALRVSRYYGETAELAQRVSRAQGQAEPLPAREIADAVHEFRAATIRLVDAADAGAGGFSSGALTVELDRYQERYQALKAELLRAGTETRIPVRQMVNTLDMLSDVRRAGEQMVKAARHLANLERASREEETSGNTPERERAAN
jgi:phosphate:Na+ symporter